ncbi:3-oxoacyl-[acyl-carrier-protein] synthase, mitochondrial [Neolecta irregularis DAH-3]|uniref:3-oxoacyl-[acyl-carrier-protein] synthase n=1 Tax=Neolecta irregularis (strain DAH-3) TaxID=1198029 RepID=A0A1U7LUG9_NEOID|nr:3-oxoacyl-[acyl-carrier-protein] synthase, mitochondrial [Neolecta irregularis DAH-3]|eukprot:OLL26320.1 3-oxoacyl-[acyl-carrier-protein] synthase, mitochondrial [Neolecta irregularis DAH-3]
MTARRVVVTGLGLVTPLGVGVSKTWTRLINGECGIVSLIGRNGDDRYRELSSTIGGVIPLGKYEEGGWDSSNWLNPGDDRRMAMFTQYAISAAEQALDDAEWKPSNDEQKDRTGACIGSGIGSFDDIVSTAIAYEAGVRFPAWYTGLTSEGPKKVSPMFIPRILINMAAGHICMRHGFRGPNHAVSTACTTGAHAIGDAARFIHFGDADIMLAGGSEASISPLAIAGFVRAKSLATEWNDRPQDASRPFDKARGGFVIGEGAGIMVLEELEHAKNRGARVYAELSGYGVSADAYQMTAPPEDGSGAILSMERALKHAGIRPFQVDYVNAHATSTKLGDVIENRAIKKVLLSDFGHSKPEDVNISSTKGAIGHSLGAAGSIEAIFSVLAMFYVCPYFSYRLTPTECTPAHSQSRIYRRSRWRVHM